MKTNYILTIAGNDVLSGGGFQADLATFANHGLFGFLAQTCMTANGPDGFEIIPTDLVPFQKQLDSLSTVDFAIIKIGLLPTPQIALAVLDFIQSRPQVPVVLDPVLVFKENDDDSVSTMQEIFQEFFTQVTVITPNLKEAEILSDMSISSLADMEIAAQVLKNRGAHNVVIKGGNRLDTNQAIDVLLTEDGLETFQAPLLNKNNNGAGCTFSSAIASHLAVGDDISTAVSLAKSYVTSTIKHANSYGVTLYENKNQ
ncbi:bifunctional hydroxymethylpyrimidine kinase/phosphomethylpyrimidine kinase [Streptococcus sp. X16XC17]|uniref:bifunctional hydroxymethylpyrimidine kinase/phosphomethylpyrimidine kinase n=1 Tax=unclassified Streptococcus TaxID=2608887 RepID=UPI00066FE854|nr:MULTISPECIES: bifunctional hydroxymethylpyrimidine kinase/phosphomethylpyrimidine kinase [unclassified Streptococcus]TCD45716.1 bifunctional hydroxymethylpyrimidine kinase/phosphomethylpyrimidine kinase [Streptococcus sp. X16XC17]